MGTMDGPVLLDLEALDHGRNCRADVLQVGIGGESPNPSAAERPTGAVPDVRRLVVEQQERERVDDVRRQWSHLTEHEAGVLARRLGGRAAEVYKRWDSRCGGGATQGC